jgi:hypothetical protein
MNRLTRSRSETRKGVALPFVALLLVVFLGMAALAVDIGILLGARTEAQRTADASALAGASILLTDGQNDVLARSTAIDWAARNRIRGEGPVVLNSDVDVRLDSGLVRVRVFRNQDRGSAIPNIFARVIGFNTSNIATMAAAIAGAGNAVRCPLPFALVDRFWDDSEGRLSFWEDEIDSDNDVYNPGARTSDPGSSTQPTGWSNLDIGQTWRIYPESPNATPTPGWYFPLALDDPGGNEYRDWISGCGDPDTQFVIGQDIDIEPGRMTGPTSQGFSNMLDGDNAQWSIPLECPVAADDLNTCIGPTHTTRIRPILIISPMEEALTQSGRQTVEIVNLAGVFVICHGPLRAGVTPATVTRRDQCSNPTGQDAPVWVRFMGLQGEIGSGSIPNSNSLIRVLRLVE